ncbi:MAG: hypothetical protein LM580_04865 [Thermofilum sp.]|nr:hypothetical protein [Thermofilum sp.]
MKIVRRIERVRMLYVVDELEAMEVEGRRVTSPLISDLLLSSTSIERRGGDIYAVLRDKMRSVFNSVWESYKSLRDKMKLVGDVILTVYGVLPPHPVHDVRDVRFGGDGFPVDGLLVRGEPPHGRGARVPSRHAVP